MNRVPTAQRAIVFSASWVAVTVAVYVISGVIFHFPGGLPPNNGEVFDPSGLAGALVNGLATGVLVGVSQVLLLRIVGLATWRWAAGTALALLVIHAIGDVFPRQCGPPVNDSSWRSSHAYSIMLRHATGANRRPGSIECNAWPSDSSSVWAAVASKCSASRTGSPVLVPRT